MTVLLAHDFVEYSERLNDLVIVTCFLISSLTSNHLIETLVPHSPLSWGPICASTSVAPTRISLLSHRPRYPSRRATTNGLSQCRQAYPLSDFACDTHSASHRKQWYVGYACLVCETPAVFVNPTSADPDCSCRSATATKHRHPTAEPTTQFRLPASLTVVAVDEPRPVCHPKQRPRVAVHPAREARSWVFRHSLQGVRIYISL